MTDEAREFMVSRGLDCNFQAVTYLTEQVFRDPSEVIVEFHQDPEIADLRWLVVTVVVPWEEYERVPPARKEWYRRMEAILPAPGVRRVRPGRPAEAVMIGRDFLPAADDLASELTEAAWRSAI